MYPFRLGTTSFIYPDHYVPNVKALGAFMDEIELLLFESAPVESLLSRSVIADLGRLSRELNLTYNIHLPTDISIAASEAAARLRAVDTLNRLIEQTASLMPTAYALHIPLSENICDRDRLGRWQDHVRRSLEKILAAGTPGALMAVETLDYPLEVLGPVLSDLNLAVCMDIGHLIVHGYDVQAFFDRFSERIALIHLHGVAGSKDHLPLDRLPAKWIGPVLAILNQFKGSVSLEVFSFDALNSSLNFLENCRNVRRYG